MVVRRLDARRRRLVIDPAAATGDADSGGHSTALSINRPVPSSPPLPTKLKNTDARAYSYGADRRNQLKTTDLIPKRVSSYLRVVLVLLACLAAINFCATQSLQWYSQIGDSGLIAFAIGGQGSLANWFLSFLLIMTGLSCLQIYAIRQHRCDDYRGTYRLWMWMAALFVLASVQCVVDVGAVASGVAQALTKQAFADRVGLLMTAKLLALSIIVARVLYEVRDSRGTLALVVFVWVAYTSASVLQLPVAKSGLVVLSAEMIAGNCILFGTAALLLAHLTYGRFIFLQANGLIKPKLQTKIAAKKLTATKKKTGNPSQSATDSATATASKTESNSAPKATVIGDSPLDNRANNSKKSPSDVLKELAAASRAKANSAAQSVASVASVDSKEGDSSDRVIRLSKTQRRKNRKLEKQRRRAA